MTCLAVLAVAALQFLRDSTKVWQRQSSASFCTAMHLCVAPAYMLCQLTNADGRQFQHLLHGFALCKSAINNKDGVVLDSITRTDI